MLKCKRVKNPCKICLRSVTRKTGLQCQGSCECWVHFSCLNYTPGKIKDIKAGIIKITCPCPDCKSTLPKEIRTDEPLSCSSMECPAKRPPLCDIATCPLNSEGPNKMNQTSTNPLSRSVPLKCGKDCKQNRPAQRIPGNGPLAQEQHSASGALKIHIPGDHTQSPMEGMPSLRALEQMVHTVGQLTNQIKCLMNKMRQIVQERSRPSGECSGGGNKNGAQKDPESMCPNPCFCPGNPRQSLNKV